MNDIQKATNFETTQHIMVVQRLLNDMIKLLLDRSTTHDQSKLRSEEVDGFVEFTPKLKATTYGSEEYKQHLRDMKPALDHHYANNRHHPEHFENGVEGMTVIDLLEMIVDWKAATLRHADGDLNRSIDLNAGRFNLSPQLISILRNTADLIESRQVDLNTWSQKV